MSTALSTGFRKRSNQVCPTAVVTPRRPIRPILRRGRFDESHGVKALRLVLPAEIGEGNHSVQAEHFLRRVCSGSAWQAASTAKMQRTAFILLFIAIVPCVLDCWY